MQVETDKPYSAKGAVKELRTMVKQAKAGGDQRAAMVLSYAATRISKQIRDPLPEKEFVPEDEPEVIGIQTTWRHRTPTQYGLKPLLTKETT